jgi:hypothetical protein
MRHNLGKNMCWSGEASLSLAAVSFITVGYVVKKGENFLLWIPLLYAALMELLQAYTYLYIDRCSLPQNQLATYLGYLHISFQPVFINMAYLYFIPADVRKKTAFFAMTVCFVFIILALIRIYPFDWAPLCHTGSEAPLCGSAFCSVHGNWHIAWEMPYRIYFFQNWVYAAPVFILPLLYGCWKPMLYMFFTGPPLALLTTNNPNEWPAVWCLFSIGLIFLVIKTPLRDLLKVKKWYFFRYPAWLTSKEI